MGLLRALTLLALVTTPVGCVSTATTTAGHDAGTVAAMGPKEELQLGERMYRKGILPSGEPMRAVVQGDMEVEGTMFSCQSCHLRSGVGSIEGTVITLPTNAGWLFQPLVGARMRPTSRDRMPEHLRRGEFRPAYTHTSLAKALRSGVDPSGRELNLVMPRYPLSGRDMGIMINYLKNLSAEYSPGVTPETLHFATVIAGDVDPVDRAAMLQPLQAHIRAVNSQTRYQGLRAEHGPWFKEEKFTAFRRLELDVWELTGPPDSWRAQLAAFLRAKPVFALLGGISSGDWRPIHEFCEENQLPSLFPVTDFPVISETDWYTLYLSKGWYQEGETAAKYLRGPAALPPDARIVQVRWGDPAGGALARGFQEGRRRLGQAPAEEVVLEPGLRLDGDFWTRLSDRHRAAVLVLWLDAGDLSGIGALAAAPHAPKLVFVSGKRLGDEVFSLPESVRPITYVTMPYSLPEDGKERTQLAVRQWLRAQDIPPTNERIQSQMYFLGSMLAGGLMMMRHDFYRDYLLDEFDMMRDEYYTVVTHPRLSFGPGQRYAAKGTYVVQVAGGAERKLVRRSDWVVH